MQSHENKFMLTTKHVYLMPCLCQMYVKGHLKFKVISLTIYNVWNTQS